MDTRGKSAAPKDKLFFLDFGFMGWNQLSLPLCTYFFKVLGVCSLQLEPMCQCVHCLVSNSCSVDIEVFKL